MRILFVTPEIADFVQVGGLAAVSAALPRALQRFADIRVIIPGYSAVLATLPSVEIVGSCPASAGLPACRIARSKTVDGLPIYVVLCPELFERGGTPYCDADGRDWADNDVRFARFALAAALVAGGAVDPAWSADVVHANDWPAALVPAYLAWTGLRIPSILTIHNLAYQGLFGRDSMGRIGAPDSAFQIEGIEFYNKLSFLKAGIVYASQLTTVSQTYAREITTAQFGCGLEGLLKRRADASELSGILNGIDESWDPRCCADLARPFASGDWSARSANLQQIRREFGLAVSRGPLFALVARLVHQKGVDLVLSAVETIVRAGGQLIVTGKGEARFEEGLRLVQARHPDAVGLHIGFDDGEARRIFAGSDFTLMPSRFEPCGLSQMYAQRFGSIPIGHNTGGLAETISDGSTGFLFDQPSTEAFLGGLCRAFSLFGSNEHVARMRAQAMSRTFGWKESAKTYHDLYRKAA